jgi:hypothetical protein
MVETIMDIDTEKVDEAVLAVLYLTLHDMSARGRASIGTPWLGYIRRGSSNSPQESRSRWCSQTKVSAGPSIVSADTSPRASAWHSGTAL